MDTDEVGERGQEREYKKQRKEVTEDIHCSIVIDCSHNLFINAKSLEAATYSVDIATQ